MKESASLGASLLKRAARQRVFPTASLLAGFALGVAYRALFDPANESDFGNFLRSGLHGVGLALTIWVVQGAFASGARSRLGAMLRQAPLAVEVVVRALAMTAALVVVGLSLQFVLYLEPYHLNRLTMRWLTVELPRIVAVSFGLSLVVGVAVETQRLIGGPAPRERASRDLSSPGLQRAHRHVPRHRQFDAARRVHGEPRVYDLITRFFYDIDEPISDCGGRVHAYVGDEVIVNWRLSEDKARNARCVACFFAIEAKLARLAPEYAREFGLAPSFRAGLRAGRVVVSEAGDEKRQFAFFGDTMNVAARLCEYCKTIDARLVVSGDLLGA